jgi:hypothetical protein
MFVLAPGLSLSIIIDSRVKIIDNERPGASPCDPRGRLHANNTKSIDLYDFTFHVHILRFHWDFFIFYFIWRQQIENK